MSMNNNELAKIIYTHIIGLNRSSEGWDKWDDKREIEFIESLIRNNTPAPEHKRFTDEWGNSDWRDTGEMGG